MNKTSHRPHLQEGRKNIEVEPNGHESKRVAISAGGKKTAPVRSISKPFFKVALVEDHVVMREGIASLLNEQADMQVVGQAGDVPSGLSMVAKVKPQVVLIDISLKGGNGLELVKTLAAQDANLPMLVLSMHEESMHAQAALRAGARGYIMKCEDIGKILAAIRQILAGKPYLSPDMVNRMILNNVKGRDCTNTSPTDVLSDREMQVFQMISEWKGPSQIAHELNLSVKTVEYYRENIKKKLTFHTTAELMQFALGYKSDQNSAAC